MWMTPPRRRGADLGISDGDSRLSVVVENKLAGGPAQWCPVTFADPAALRNDPAARRYAARIAAALADTSQMPVGAQPHDCRNCGCNWFGGYHGRAYGGGWVCGIPQLDFYCYYNSWLPAWVQDQRPRDVAWVYLSAVRVSLAEKYPGMDSLPRWRVVTYADFLNLLLTHPALHRPSDDAAAALDLLCQVMWNHMPWSAVDGLDGAVRHRIESAGV
jgi:hypothetical protein